jgi:hypothetical protein
MPMPKEVPHHHNIFDFTDNEKLFERVRHERLLALLEQADTHIHEVTLSTNTYGEFMFVSLTKQGDPFPGYVSFWGLGLHEQRERWLTEEWCYFRSAARTSLKEKTVPREEAQQTIEQRRLNVLHWAAQEKPQSKRGRLFEMIADLTDEDGAYSELQDLEDAGIDPDDLFA